MQTANRRVALIVLVVPVLMMLAVGLAAGIAGNVIGHTLLGMLGVAVGGVTAGVTAKRFLAHANNDREMLYGLGVTSAIGVFTMGYIYLFYLNRDMATIRTLPRTYEQSFIFVAFLGAQYAGVQWAHRWFPGFKKEEAR